LLSTLNQFIYWVGIGKWMTNWTSNMPYSRGLNVNAAPERTIRPAELKSLGLLYLKMMRPWNYLASQNGPVQNRRIARKYKPIFLPHQADNWPLFKLKENPSLCAIV